MSASGTRRPRRRRLPVGLAGRRRALTGLVGGRVGNSLAGRLAEGPQEGCRVSGRSTTGPTRQRTTTLIPAGVWRRWGPTAGRGHHLRHLQITLLLERLEVGGREVRSQLPGHPNVRHRPRGVRWAGWFGATDSCWGRRAVCVTFVYAPRLPVSGWNDGEPFVFHYTVQHPPLRSTDER